MLQVEISALHEFLRKLLKRGMGSEQYEDIDFDSYQFHRIRDFSAENNQDQISRPDLPSLHLPQESRNLVSILAPCNCLPVFQRKIVSFRNRFQLQLPEMAHN